MRVLIVNTSDRTGGAAVAANRLMEALRHHGIKAKMLVRDKQTDTPAVCALPQSWRLHWHFLWERMVIWLHLHLRREHLFDVDIANVGTDITQLPEFREADVIHLHWINQGMLSLKGIRKILESGKPVVWTMHDIWPATAVCHLTLECRNFETQCRQCRLLPEGGSDTAPQSSAIKSKNDFATSIWRKKQQLLAGRPITFVACSQWLAGEARKSALLKGQNIMSIPNTLDTRVFRPSDRQQSRRLLGLPSEGRLVLFASQRVTNQYKGMSYLVEACRQLAAQHPGQTDDLSVAILGGHAEEMVGQLPFPTYALGYLNDDQRIVAAYSAADVFVLPSLSENLPNTIMEAMACGVPSVGFRVGGIPEEIDHRQNGYVADYRSSSDLARGIWWVLYESDPAAVRQACQQKVARHYSQQSVAKRYIEVYEDLCSHHHV